MVNASRASFNVLNNNIERSVKAALRAGINAGGNCRAVEFFSTRDTTTMNARMEVRQFAMGTIRVACHLSPRFCPVSRLSGQLYRFRRKAVRIAVGSGRRNQ